MATVTQKSKKAKYVLAAIIIVIVIIGIIGLLSVLKNANGNPYINLAPVNNALLGEKMWSSVTTVNAIIDSLAFIVLGFGLCYVFYYVRGQKTTTAAAATSTGYAPIPSYPSQPSQSGQETTIS